jgi:pimeloyl-ACP methyl ester carboxylesterase
MVLVALFTFLDFFGLIFPLSRLNPDPTKQSAILIVERWLSQNPAHFLMKKYLEKKGFKVYLVNFSLFEGDFMASSQSLANFIEKNNLANITLVGISFGSITAYLYLQKYSGWEKVKQFIAIAPPFHGTPRANLFLYLKSGRQMKPNSQFIKNYLSEKVLNPDKIVCIRALQDEMVPTKSSLLDGVKVEIVRVYGHNNLHTMSKRTFSLISSYTD